jgi:hydroxymethylglutaryl-CoA reductase (NADPH)
MMNITSVPTRWLTLPMRFHTDDIYHDVTLPLATYETPLWASVGRGAKMARHHGGVTVACLGCTMTRSVLLYGQSLADVLQALTTLKDHDQTLKIIAAQTSRYITLKTMHTHVTGHLLFIRFSFDTQEASGHNMATKASDALLQWVIAHTNLTYGSVSGNVCVDKKTSAINSICGRGRYMVAECWLSLGTCHTGLHTTPHALTLLNTCKNYIGSIIAGSVCSANAQVANVLLAAYIATGQDGANVVEGSQAMVTCLEKDNGLLFSLTLPNVIVGVIGHGKCQHVMEKMGNPTATMLAARIAVAAWCAEISLLAAQTNPGELMRAHLAMER